MFLGFVAGFGEKRFGFHDPPWERGISISVGFLGGRDRRAEEG